MKIELIKWIHAETAKIYYYVRIDGIMDSQTFTDDYEKARQSYLTTKALLMRSPSNNCEVLESIEV